MSRSFCRFLFGFCVALLSLASVRAQVQVGARLFGNITDPAGAAVPGANVSFTMPATGATQSVMTGDDGSYVFPQIQAGVYDITVAKEGFKTSKETGIQVRINESVRANIQLEVGSIATTVEVKGRAELTNSYTAQLSQTIDSRRVQDLPLNGRDVTSLSLIVAGANIDSTATSFYGTSSGFQETAPIVNGNRNQDNIYLLDGVSNQYQNRRVSNLYPNPDAIEEFTMNTAQYSAEYGGNPGAQLSARTKSGTNAVHGSLFEFVRNGALNARNQFDRTGKNDGLRRNQYGWAVGGPVYIPRIFDRRNKLFWFNSMQKTPIRLNGVPGFHQSWTRKQKDGDFTEHLTGRTIQAPSPLCDGSMVTVDTGTIFDPSTANSRCGAKGFPFAGNVIPRSRLDPVMQKVLNEHTPDSPFLGAQIPFFIPKLSDEYQVVTKIDYLIKGHSIMGRHIQGQNAGKSFSDTTGKNIIWGSDPNAGGSINVSKSVAFTDTWTVRPNLLVTGGFAYIRNPWSVSPWPFQLTWAEVGSRIPVDTSPADPQSICREFALNTLGVANIRTWDKCGARKNRFWDSNGAVKWVRGTHEISMGGSLGREYVSGTGGTGSAQRGGFFTIGSQFSGIAQADAVLGLPQLYTVMNFGFSTAAQRSMAALYVQDNYRVSRKLTLNLGMRWEPAFAQFPENGYNAWIRAGAKSQRFPKAPVGLLYFGDPDTPGASFYTRWNQVAPRFGFALDPRGDGKWAIRGGIGRYIGMVAFGGQTLDQAGGTFPPAPSGTISITNPPNLTWPWDAPPFNGRIGIPISAPNADSPVPLPLAGNAHDPYTKAPNVTSWSLTVEHTIGNDLLLRAGYVGSHGVHLIGGENVNLPVFIPGGSTAQNVQARRPDQNFAGLWIASGNQNSFYQSVQLSAEKRYSSGLTFLANYTLSKSIDDGSSPVGWGFGIQDPRGPRFNRGLSDFDRTHVVSTSVVWDLPKFSTASPVVRHVVGNWQASSIVYLRSGAPFTLVSSKGNSLSPGQSTGQDRADTVPGTDWQISGRNRSDQINIGYFNQKAFTDPPLGGRGNVGRNTIRGPGYADTDFMLGKVFPIRERVRLQFRSEYFNLFNRVNLANPNGDVNNPSFGKIFTAGDPRILQFGLKLQF